MIALQLPEKELELVDRLLDLTLDEDVGEGDATTQALFKDKAVKTTALFNARAEGVMAGGAIVGKLYEKLSQRLLGKPDAIELTQQVADGKTFSPGVTLLTIQGDSDVILTGERSALNLLQRMCAIATRTRSYVDKVIAVGGKASILDTRKTNPGHRILDKMAVVAGGGVNHRMGLYDMILIKDNHLAAHGTPASAIRAARSVSHLPIMIEVDDFGQLLDSLAAEPDYVLLDNMSPAKLAEAVKLTDEQCSKKNLRRPLLEASGGVNLETVGAIAKAGVDRISVGALTHGAGSIDIGLDFE